VGNLPHWAPSFPPWAYSPKARALGPVLSKWVTLEGSLENKICWCPFCAGVHSNGWDPTVGMLLIFRIFWTFLNWISNLYSYFTTVALSSKCKQSVCLHYGLYMVFKLCCVWMFSMQFIINFGTIKSLFWEAEIFFKMCSQNAGNTFSETQI
jgi:hypothetical protein